MDSTYFLKNIMKRYSAFLKDTVEYEAGDFWRKKPIRIFTFREKTGFKVRVYDAKSRVLYDYSKILNLEVTRDNCFSVLSDLPHKAHKLENLTVLEAEKIMENNIKVTLRMPALRKQVEHLKEIKKAAMNWRI